ncbi:response regulator transcription factor [Streptomyces sp. SID12488]|uniref:LuxR C-terminal-related transcriptional regulator n=1 Tax=Streptomyces sp. SID12488 TaxID=2706040 RepID=UPI0013DC98DE|nr:response regulator transcription factor [Streptomyces sp. SID12488]NEA62806.1 response regulator transcription factor [Streptomyces sp. SID12488]
MDEVIEIEIGCIDDALMDLEGKAVALKAKSEVRVVTMAASVEEFLSRAPRPKIVTLDLHLGDGTLPADNVTALVEAGHKVIVLTVIPEFDWVQETTEAGASAYLHKSNRLETLVTVIREVHAGEVPTTADHAFHLARDSRPSRPHLTPRELEILEMVSTGMTHKAIARRLDCASSTVATHLASVRGKYDNTERPITKPTDYRDRLRERQLDRDRLDPES